jgi:hypothetical protein
LYEVNNPSLTKCIIEWTFRFLLFLYTNL